MSSKMDTEKQMFSVMPERIHSSHEKNTESVEPGVERTLIRKLDLVFLPMLGLAYLLAYMDRNNIGYAVLMNFKTDLGLSSQQYYDCVMIFFAGYLACVFPANLLIRKVGPNLQLGSAVILFGLFVCCMCAARGSADVLGLRFGIGGAEALLQAVPIYMMMWYGKHEIGKRIAIFYSAATLSGVFSGLIAYGVQKNLDIPGKRPAWEWLFLIEGTVAIALGLLMIVLLPGNPDKMKNSWLLDDKELICAVARFQDLNRVGSTFQLRQVKRSLLDPKTYYLAFLAATNSTILASTGAFLPTIVKAFGFSSLNAQLFTVIPYACAFVTMIGVGILSDKVRNKGFFILGSLSSCLVGLIILLTTTTKTAGMIGACFLVLGGYTSAVLQIAWIQVTFCGHTKRAVSWGVATIFGQGFSLLGSQIYTNPPRFVKGHATLLGLVVWAMIMTVAAEITMKRANQARERIHNGFVERGEPNPDADKSLEETCDDHVNFRYVL